MDVSFAFSVIFTGIVIVFIVLVVLIGVMMLLGKVAGEKPNKPEAAGPAPRAVAPAPKPAAPTPIVKKMEVEDGVGDEVVAVIAAAVAAFTGGTGKPVSIRRARREKAQGRSAWSAAGLRENTQPF